MEFGVVGQLQKVLRKLALFVRSMDHGDVLALIGRIAKLEVAECCCLLGAVAWAWSKKEGWSNTAVASQCEWFAPFPLLSDWKMKEKT
jgi:hypothetical protein